MGIWLVGYLVLFGMLTVQDRLSGPQPVPYSDFKTQVTNKNIAEVFARGDSIEGELKKAVVIPGLFNKAGAQGHRFLPRALLRKVTGLIKDY